MKKRPKSTDLAKIAMSGGFDRPEGDSIYGDERPGLRLPLAMVMAHHIGDVQFASRGDVDVSGKPSTENEGEGVFKISLSQDEYHAILQDLAADRPGDVAKLDPEHLNAAQVITGAQLAYGATAMQRFATDPQELAKLSPEDRQDEEQRARADYLAFAANQQKALVESISHLGAGLVAIGRKKDEAEAFSKAMVEMGAGILPVDMVSKSPGVGMLVGEGYEFASKNIIESLFKLDAEEKATKSAKTFASSTIALHYAQVEQGYTQVSSWSGRFSPEAWARDPDNQRRDNEGYSYEGERFFDEDGNILPRSSMTAEQFDAYCNWRDGFLKWSASPEYDKYHAQVDQNAAIVAAQPVKSGD
ncbi:MAG: hypothetical protein ACRC0L_12210, partial [Angustibacter sp.]